MSLPDLSRILGRPSVKRPEEEFILPALTELPVPPGRPEGDGFTPGPPLLQQLKQELVEEMGHLQELSDLVGTTAPSVEAPVPEAEQSLFGPRITGADYLASLKDRSPKGRRLRRHFENGSGQGCGVNLTWPLMLAPRLLGLRDELAQTLGVLEGTLMSEGTRAAQEAAEAAAQAKGQPVSGAIFPHWGADAARSLDLLARTQVAGARLYRSAFARSVATYEARLSREVLQCLFNHLGQETLRRDLQSLLELLQQLKQLLCLAMLLRMLQFQQVRDALEKLLEGMLLEAFLQQLAVLIQQAEQTLLGPLLEKLSHLGADGECSFAALAGDAVSRALTETLYSTLWSLNGYFNEALSDLLRESRKRSLAALAEVQALGERNTLSMWILQLGQAEVLIRELLAGTGTLEAAHGGLKAFAGRVPEAAPSPLLRQMRLLPEYNRTLDAPWEFRPQVGVQP